MKKPTPPPTSKHRLKIIELRQKIEAINRQIEHYRKLAKPKKGQTAKT
jgi:hypothetical protein